MFKKYIILFVLLIADIALYFYRYAYGFWLEVVFAGLVWLSAVAAIRRIAEYINRRKFKAWIKRLIITALDIVEIFALLAAFIYCYQDAALFHPNDDPASREYILSQADFTEITVNDGKTAYTGYMKRTGGDVPSPLIIMFTGNAQNAAQAMASIDYAGAWGSFLGCDMLIMDYPGYGLNRGAPSSVSICREALLTYDYAGGLPYVDASRIIIGGFSIGTGPAVYLAANRPAAGLFLLAPYASGYDLYNSVLPVFRGPLRLLVKNRFPSYQYAATITAPVLIVASMSDEIVPFSSSETLSKCFPNEPKFVTLSAVFHNEILFDRTSLDSILGFLKSIR